MIFPCVREAQTVQGKGEVETKRTIYIRESNEFATRLKTKWFNKKTTTIKSEK